MRARCKKAQIAGQMFIFIIAIFLAALILLFGYRAINDFLNRADRIALVNFQENINDAVTSVASDYGKVQPFEVNVPTEYKVICLVDFDKDPGQYNICDSNEPDFSPIICDAWQDKTQNVFLTDVRLTEMTEISITVSSIEIDQGYLCEQIKNGKVTLKLEGLGNRAKVSKWA